MPIPDFNDAGNLPPGRHAATVKQVSARLVDAFPTSRTRSAIFHYWNDHRDALRDIAPLRSQWLAGSFTSSKPDPNDVDVVTVLDGQSYDDLPRHRQLVLNTLISGHYTEQFWNCDAYPLLFYPPGHPGHSQYLLTAERWTAYFGHDRNGNLRGFVEVKA